MLFHPKDHKAQLWTIEQRKEVALLVSSFFRSNEQTLTDTIISETNLILDYIKDSKLETRQLRTSLQTDVLQVIDLQYIIYYVAFITINSRS